VVITITKCYKPREIKKGTISVPFFIASDLAPNTNPLSDVIYVPAHPEREAVEGFCAYNPSTSSG
jgi:hypothetical protein